MARTYRTLSLSLPPAVFKTIGAIGKKTGRTGARVATEIVLREIAALPGPKKPETRRTSWCCQASVFPMQGPLICPETENGERHWVPAIVLLCDACGKQMLGREYEGWLGDA